MNILGIIVMIAWFGCGMLMAAAICIWYFWQVKFIPRRELKLLANKYYRNHGIRR